MNLQTKNLLIILFAGGLALANCDQSTKDEQKTSSRNSSGVTRNDVECTVQPVMVDIGDDMVDADLIDRDGHICHLSEFKGKYILLDFWNRGCGPCMKAFPEAAEIAETILLLNHIRQTFFPPML